jgi:hypothetical protein
MLRAGAFRLPLPINEMFELMPDIPREGTREEPRPARKLHVLGVEIPVTDADADLAKGGSGIIGSKIRESAQQDPFAFNVVGTAREAPILPPKSRSRGRGPNRGSTRENEKDKVLYGRLGEIFVYELLKLQGIPGFDEAAWQSQSRYAYLGEGLGDDSLGYDFRFVDPSGRLTARPGSVCLLEVKSSTGSADGPFQMSENEWDRAIEAYQSSDEVYVILRVSHVNQSPRIADMIVDPYRLRRENKILLVADNLWVYPGRTALSDTS